MRDPIEELENLTAPGLTMTPMPASEVRRRGARMRRRNTALATVGGIAAVAVIVTPLAVLAGNRGDSGPQPTPEPKVSWVQTIPDGFPITAGMPDGSTASSSDEAPYTQACGKAIWSAEGTDPTTDYAQAFYHVGNEGGRDRTLAIYPDDERAATAFATFEDTALDCSGHQPNTAPGDTITPERRDPGLGEDSVTVVYKYGDAGGLTGEMNLVQVVRVGNALLIDGGSGTGAGDPAVVDDLVTRVATDAEPVVTDLCLFSAEGCAGDAATVS